MIDELINQAAKAIIDADALLITAGAGMGVDSGLPDYRGDKGFWKAYPVLESEGMSFASMATPACFHESLHRAWGFYGHRFQLYNSTTPHNGFNILKKWRDLKLNQTFVFTSNIDGHFIKSGFSDESIYECHGSINYLQCLGVCDSGIWPVTHFDFKVNTSSLTAVGDLPRCPLCGSMARPNVLMFSDYDWNPQRANRQNSKFKNWKAQNEFKNIVVVEIGAGTEVPTVRLLSESMGGTVIRINSLDCASTTRVMYKAMHTTIPIKLGALEALNRIDKEIFKLS